MRGSTFIEGSAVSDQIFSYSTAGGGTLTVGTAAYPVALMQFLSPTAALVVGTDPGTSEIFRVGGSARFNAGAATTIAVGAGSVAGAMQVQLSSAAGQNRQVQFLSGGSARWSVRADSTAESGANAGTAFQIIASADNGATIDTPIVIVRAAGGTMTFTRPLIWGTDNAVDIGASAATRPRTGYFGTSIVIAGDPGGTEALRLTGGIRSVGILRILVGDMTLGANEAADRSIAVSSAAGQNRNFLLQTNLVNRWIIRASTDAESGADAGSNLQIAARTDAGGAIDVPLQINRAAGSVISIARPVNIAGTGAGLAIGSPTGGNKGAGTINISGLYYANGTAGVSGTSTPGTGTVTVVNGIVTAVT